MSNASKEAFTTTLRPHLTRLYRLAYRLAGSKSDAEDLLQDVLTKLYERRDEISSIRELSPWLGRVVYNQFVDNHRRYGRSPVQLVGDVEADFEASVGWTPVADTASEPQNAAHRADLHAVLSRALARLSEEHRVVLLMHDAEGYKLAEIQELTGTPVGTVKSRLHRARARLRELLSGHEPAPAQSQRDSSKKTGTFSDRPACKPVDGVGNDVL